MPKFCIEITLIYGDHTYGIFQESPLHGPGLFVSITLLYLTWLQHTRLYGRVHHTTSLDTAAVHESLRPCPPNYFTWHGCSTRESTAVSITLLHLTRLQYTRHYGRVHHTTSLDTAAVHESVRPCLPHYFTWHGCSTWESTAVSTTLLQLIWLQYTRVYSRVHHTTSLNTAAAHETLRPCPSHYFTFRHFSQLQNQDQSVR